VGSTDLATNGRLGTPRTEACLSAFAQSFSCLCRKNAIVFLPLCSSILRLSHRNHGNYVQALAPGGTT
jgi:hypothetical protein